jgi:DNA-binding NarL/FixJ family response regulator
VLLADDQALVRSGFRMLVEAQPDMDVVAEASDGGEAVAEALRVRPDVALMDVRMPRMDGIEATRAITEPEAGLHTSVLILTTYDVDEYVFRGLRAGASGFLLKDVAPEDLVKAVRLVADGESLLSPFATKRLIERFVQTPEALATPPHIEELTDREREVLVLIGRGLSNVEIAQRLFLSVATVKTHVNRLFAKLRVRDRVQAVVLTYESGLVRPGDSALGTDFPDAIDGRLDR